MGSEAVHRCDIPIAFRIGIALFIDYKILKYEKDSFIVLA